MYIYTYIYIYNISKSEKTLSTWDWTSFPYVESEMFGVYWNQIMMYIYWEFIPAKPKKIPPKLSSFNAQEKEDATRALQLHSAVDKYYYIIIKKIHPSHGQIISGWKVHRIQM